MTSKDRDEPPDIARETPKTQRAIEILRQLRVENPGEDLQTLLFRLQDRLPPWKPSDATSEGWEPFTLE